MPSGQEKALTGWDSSFKSIRIILNPGNYSAISNFPGNGQLFGVRGKLPFNRSINRWAWEFKVIGNTPLFEKSIYGVSKLFAPINGVNYNLSTVTNGTVYDNTGNIFGTSYQYSSLGDGDILTFILDYQEQFLAVAKNGIFQGFMLTSNNFITNNDLYPYFATSVSGNGVLLKDGTPLPISTSDQYSLFNPVGSQTPINLAFTYDPITILPQFNKNITYRPYYYAGNPYSFVNITQDNTFTLSTNNITSKPSLYSPSIQENLIPVFWDSINSTSNVIITRNNLLVSGIVIGISQSNRPVTIGKIYWEYKIMTGSNGVSVGINTSSNSNSIQYVGYDNKSWGISSGTINHNNIVTPITETFIDGDIINIAIDIDTGMLWFGINGIYINNGSPAQGINPSFTNVIGNIFPAVSSRINTSWEILGQFTRLSTSLPPINFNNIDGTTGPTTVGRPHVTWNQNSASQGQQIFDKTTIVNNNAGNILSEGNLHVVLSGAAQPFTYSTRSHTSGKYYVEFQIINIDNTTLSTFIGLSTLPNTNNNIILNQTSNNILYFGSQNVLPKIRSNFGTFNTDGNTFIIGDIVQMAIDFDTGKIWFGVNGIWSSGNPNLGINPNWQGILNDKYFYILIGGQSTTSVSELKINFGATPYAFSIPSGFTTWNIPDSQGWDRGKATTSVTITNNNLNVSGSFGLYSGLSSYGHETGKHYFEITVAALSTVPGKTAMVGIAKNNIHTTAFLGSTVDSWSLWQLNGNSFNNNTVNNIGIIPWNNINDVVMIAVDIDAGSMWFGINGVWLDNSNPSINLNPRYNNLSGMVFPAYGNDSSSFGEMGELSLQLSGQFKYTIPIGFSDWDTGITTSGGIQIASDNVTASGNGSVIATDFINASDLDQFYMEFNILDTTSISGIGLEVFDPSNIIAHQYWRIKTTILSNNVDINEIEMFESSQGGIDVTDPTFAISDSELNNNFLAAYAFNNTYSISNTTTSGVRWSSNMLLNQERYIGQNFGIGNEKNIKRISIKGGLTSSVSWDLQHSDDNVIWTTIKKNIFVSSNVTTIINSGDNNNIEQILYQSSGALGPLNTGSSVTFDPLKASSTWQLLNNIQVADIGFIGMIQATRNITTGRKYWEIRIEPPTSVQAAIIGFVPAGTLYNSFPGQLSGVGIHAGTGNIWIDGIETPFSSPLSIGDVISFSVDLNLGYAWIGINNTWIIGNPELNISPAVQGLSGNYFAAVGDSTNTLTETVAYTANFGQYIYINTKPLSFEDYGPISGDGTYDTYTAGDVIGIAVDATSRQIWWSKNNKWIIGNAILNLNNPAILLGNMRIIFDTLSGSISANFGDTFFEQNIFRNFNQFGCGVGGFHNTPSIIWGLGQGTLREQQLRYKQSGIGARTLTSTIGITKKWYAEFTVLSTATNVFFGVLNNLIYYNGSLCVTDINFCGPNILPNLNVGDIIMIAINEITNKGWFGINGVWFNGGLPEINLNEIVTVNVSQEIVFGTSPTGLLDIKANLGTEPFTYTIPFNFVPFDTNIIQGSTLLCSNNAITPLLQTQGVHGFRLGSVKSTIHKNEITNINNVNINSKTGNFDILSKSGTLNDFFPNQSINIISIEQYVLTYIFNSISSDVILNNNNHAPFSGQIPFIQLITGESIKEGLNNSVDFIVLQADTIGTIRSPLKFSSINISTIYDYASRLQGHNFNTISILSPIFNTKPNWPLPNRFRVIVNEATPFNNINPVANIEIIKLSTSTTPQATVPVHSISEINVNILFKYNFIKYGFVLPVNLIDKIKAGTKLFSMPNANRTVYSQPQFPEKISGRIQGG